MATSLVAVLAVAIILMAGPGSRPTGTSGSPGASGPALVAGSGSGLSVASATPLGSPVASGPSAEPPSPSASPAATGAPLADVPIVPVVDFRSTEASVRPADVEAILAGTSKRYDALELVAGDADAILAGLGLERPSDPGRLITAKDGATLAKDLAKQRDRLAFLRADQVTPAVRALAWGSPSLFGVDRARTAAGWTLTARLPATLKGAAAFDPASTWTLVAGGDILLDRGVSRAVKVLHKGVDFPFSGGTATITGTTCCSALHNPVPITRRTGNAGAVRDLLKSADIALANFENPAPNAFRYHTSGTVFSADPKLIAGLRNAGIDVVSLANNHIRDAGAQGILDTIRNLEKYGLKHAGAGANLAAARRPAIVTTHGVKVAILGYDAIAGVYAAGPARAGNAHLALAAVRADIAKARAAGAQVVIVFPHWGTEYTSRPSASQRALARSIIDAGADMIIGNHAHYVAAMEVYKGRPIWYALGNFVFDQDWSVPTMEGITLEMTFSGNRLLQVTMRPHVILDKAQPNFMNPAGSGRAVMGQLFNASKGMLAW